MLQLLQLLLLQLQLQLLLQLQQPLLKLQLIASPIAINSRRPIAQHVSRTADRATRIAQHVSHHAHRTTRTAQHVSRNAYRATRIATQHASGFRIGFRVCFALSWVSAACGGAG